MKTASSGRGGAHHVEGLDLADHPKGAGEPGACSRCWTTSEARERAFYADPEQYDQIPGLSALARSSLREKGDGGPRPHPGGV